MKGNIIVVILNNINSFVLLKKILYILIFIAGLNFKTEAQVRSNFVSNDGVKTVKYYPNPAVSYINFEFEKSYDNSYSLIIFNFLGKKVTDIKVTEQKITVSLSDYYRGVYIFQLRDKQGNIVESGKFQIVK
ncbi:MAG: T9SS type A sorting domain-containing protein [Bacteroidota bacterium]|nr:T9SS type A sorting domain-containing protein [Bacteroidota bacterium]